MRSSKLVACLKILYGRDIVASNTRDPVVIIFLNVLNLFLRVSNKDSVRILMLV